MATTVSSLGVGGLVSGIDTTSIVTALVAQEQRPITQLQTQQSAFRTQVSLLGDIISKLSALRTAAHDLGTQGALAAKVTSANTAFTATPGAGALAGSYSVRVDQLAQPSKWMSAAFAGGTAPVANGSLSLTIGTTSYGPITTDGMSLADLAYAIRQTGAPVSATVLSGWDTVNNKAVSYLSVTALASGYTPGANPPDSLAIAFAPGAAGAGTDPGLHQTQAATNAAFNIDGVDYLRSSNTVSDALPGLTLALKHGAVSPATQGTAEDLVLETDAAGTQAKLQKFADAYNGAMSLVQKALAVTKDTDRTTTLAGDSAVHNLQRQLQSIITNVVSGLPGVRTLADVGLKTNRDGSLTIDTTTLNDALTRDPAAIDALFSTASTGISDYVAHLVDQQTFPGTGLLTADQQNLTNRITAMDTQMAAMQARVDAYKANLVQQFAAMENVLSGLKTTANFLTSQSAAKSSG